MSLSIRDLPREERKALLLGPQAFVKLATPEGTPPLVVAAPRAALIAFSTSAAKLLKDERCDTIVLPQGSAAPAALRILMEWIKRTCEAKDFMPIPKKADLSHNIMLYHGALALGITEVKITIGGYLNFLIGDFQRNPFRWQDVNNMLILLPQTSMSVQRLVEQLTLAHCNGILSPDFERNLTAFIKKCPELRKQMDKHHTRWNNAKNSLMNHGNGPNANNRKCKGPCRNERGGGHSKRRELADASEHILNEYEVDRIMGRH